MSRDVTTAFIQEKNAETNKPLYLYTIYDYDGASNNLYYTNARTSKTFDGITYQPFPIQHEHIGENTQGEIDQVNVKASNVSRAIQAYLEEYDLRGKQVDIILVWADKLDEPENYIADTYFIDHYTADANDVTFICTTKLDILEVNLPNRLCMRNHCSWIFKSTECGYVGGDTECDHTLQECRTKGNQARFGGFPAIPSSQVYL